MLGEGLGGDRGVAPPVDPDVDTPSPLLGTAFAERFVDVPVKQWDAFVAEPELGVSSKLGIRCLGGHPNSVSKRSTASMAFG